MIESRATTAPDSQHVSEHQIAPNVFLREDAVAGQFVEIILPPFELNDLITFCEANLPEYIMRVCELLAQRHPECLTPEAKFSPARIQGTRRLRWICRQRTNWQLGLEWVWGVGTRHHT